MMLALISMFLLSSGPASTPLALAPTSQPTSVQLDHALERVQQRGVEFQVAEAEHDEAQAQARRAFSVLLPRVDVEGSYVFSCQLAGNDAVDCGDQTTQFISDDFKAAQALLFRGVADGTRAQAPLAPAEEQAALYARADALDDGAAAIEAIDNTPVVLAPAHVASGQITASVPIVLVSAWTAMQNAEDYVTLRRAAAAETLRLARLGVARAYLGAVLQDRLRRIAAARVSEAETRVNAIRKAESVGSQSELMVHIATAELLAAKTAAVEADTAALQARARVGLLIGQETDFDIVDDGLVERIVAMTPTTQARFEVEAAMLQQGIAQREAAVGWQGMIPEVRAFAQLRGTTNTGGFVAAPMASGLGVSLRWSLFDGFERNGRADVARAQGRIAHSRAMAAQRQARAEVNGAAADLAQARARLALAKAVVEVAQKRLSATELAMQEGANTVVEVSAAATAKQSAENDAAAADIGVAMATLAVLAAAGAGV
jgi:outer membrane protein TolC